VPRRIPDIRDVRGRRLAGELARNAYERWVARETAAVLTGAFRDIAARIADAELSPRDRARQLSLMRRIDAQLEEAYSRLGRDAQRTMVDYARVEAEAARQELGALAIDAGGNAATVNTIAPVLTQAFVQAVAELPIEGLRLGEWWQTQVTQMRLATRRQIQLGLVAGESPAAISRRIYPPRGSAEPAVWRRARAEAETIVRTTVTRVHAYADLMSYQAAGKDVTAWYELITARDARVSTICAALDGQRFRYDDPNRKEPPFHMRCRTTTLPILNYEALGLDPVQATRRGARAPLTVQSYDAWLRAQPTSVQTDVLGVTRAEWYRSGRMKLSETIDSDNRVLTLPELAARLGVEWPPR
jgi:SPP1 gp7 family putative phage head morphogenesis protein